MDCISVAIPELTSSIQAEFQRFNIAMVYLADDTDLKFWWSWLQVELQYLHDYAGINTSIGLTSNPIVNFSGVVGSNTLALGADLSFDTASGNFTKYNAGLSFTNADLVAALTL